MEPFEQSHPQPLLLTSPQTAQTLGLCRAHVYKLIATAGLPTIRFGRSVRVPVASLQKWVQEREANEQSA